MSITLTFSLAVLLAAPPELVDPPPSDPPPSDYAATVEEITLLSERMNSGEGVDTELQDSIVTLSKFTPQLAADPDTLQLRTRAQLQLARLALSGEDRETATWIVDEAIRSAMGGDIPIGGFGPSLAKLYAERVDALASGGKASIEVRCRQPCRVFVDEHETDLVIADLPLGVYRLWVEGTEGAAAGHVFTDVVVLEVDGEVASHVFDARPRPMIRDKPQPVEAPARSRMMPRGVEAALVAVGVGLLGAGALMMAVQPGEQPFIVGGTLLGFGGAIAIVGGVTLGVDEVRVGKQQGRQAMVAWTMRF